MVDPYLMNFAPAAFVATLLYRCVVNPAEAERDVGAADAAVGAAGARLLLAVFYPLLDVPASEPRSL